MLANETTTEKYLGFEKRALQWRYLKVIYMYMQQGQSLPLKCTRCNHLKQIFWGGVLVQKPSASAASFSSHLDYYLINYKSILARLQKTFWLDDESSSLKKLFISYKRKAKLSVTNHSVTICWKNGHQHFL